MTDDDLYETELWSMCSMLVGAGVMRPEEARKLMGFPEARQPSKPGEVLEGEIIPPDHETRAAVNRLNGRLKTVYDELRIGMPDDIEGEPVDGFRHFRSRGRVDLQAEYDDESGSRITAVIIDEAGNPPPPMPELDDAMEKCFEAVTRGFVALYNPTMRARAGEVTVMQDTRTYQLDTAYSSVSITNRPLGLIGALEGVVTIGKTLRLPPIDVKPYLGPSRNRKEMRAERARSKRRR